AWRATAAFAPAMFPSFAARAFPTLILPRVRPMTTVQFHLSVLPDERRRSGCICRWTGNCHRLLPDAFLRADRLTAGDHDQQRPGSSPVDPLGCKHWLTLGSSRAIPALHAGNSALLSLGSVRGGGGRLRLLCARSARLHGAGPPPGVSDGADS